MGPLQPSLLLRFCLGLVASAFCAAVLQEFLRYREISSVALRPFRCRRLILLPGDCFVQIGRTPWGGPAFFPTTCSVLETAVDARGFLLGVNPFVQTIPL